MIMTTKTLMANNPLQPTATAPFSFDRTMKFRYHLALLSPPPVAVAELER